MNQMVDNLAGFAGQADVISAGDYSVTGDPRSQDDELGLAWGRMTESLSEAVEKIKKDDWL